MLFNGSSKHQQLVINFASVSADPDLSPHLQQYEPLCVMKKISEQKISILAIVYMSFLQ
jgi:hypothetical protein